MSFTDTMQTKVFAKSALSENCLSLGSPDLKSYAEGSIQLHLCLSSSNMNESKEKNWKGR